MIVAYKHVDGQPRINTADSLSVVERLAWCVPGTVKEIDRLPIPGEEILDPATLTVIPDPDKARRDKLAALAATDAGVTRGIDDIWATLVAKGVLKSEDVPADLKAKLDARAALRADLAAAVK